MLNNLNDNLNPCGSGPAVQSYNMLDKRLTAVEKTIAGYPERMSSQQGDFDKLNAQTATIADAKLTSVDSDVLTAKTVKAGVLQAGLTSLGDTSVESLKIVGKGGATADLDEANIKDADIENLHVSGKFELDNPTIKRLDIQEDVTSPKLKTNEVYIKNKKALESLIQELSVGSDFKNIDFKSDMIPTWNSLELATKADVSGLKFKGIVETEAELPSTANDGDLYWISEPAAVAVFSEGTPTLTPMPALAAYRTAAEEDIINEQIQQNIDTANRDTNARIDVTNENVTNLETKVDTNQETNDATHTALRADINTNTANIETDEARIKAIEDDYVKNAPVDGNMYGMKNGSWQDLAKDSNFVPKEYKDETTDSHIYNDVNGIDISSTKPVTVSTPEEKLETSKEIVNVDYLRKNLSISKGGGTGIETMIKFKELDGFIMENGSLGANSEETGTWAYRLGGHEINSPHPYTVMQGITADSSLRTKDYIYYFFCNHGDSDTASPDNPRIYAIDKQGKSTRLISELVDGWYESTPPYRNMIQFAGFHPDYCEIHPEVANICFIIHAYRPFIEVWDGLKCLGKIYFPKDSQGNYSIESDWAKDEWYTPICNEPLRDKPEILVYKACSQQAYILGINEDNELDMMAMKRFTMPGYPGANKIAAGATYWWGLNELDNSRSSMMRIDSNGNTGSSPLQAEDGSGSVSAIDCYMQMKGWITLKNGDVVIVIQTKFAGSSDWTTGFAWCYENPEGKLLPAYYINSTMNFSYHDGSMDSASAANYPMREVGNYIFFFPTSGGRVINNGATNKAHEDARPLSKAVAGQYCIMNKTSHTITYANYPWTPPVEAYTWVNGVSFKTKGDYLWVFPPYNVADSKILVVSPNGAQQTVDIGTGSKYHWCGGVEHSLWSSSSRYESTEVSPCAAVNEDGIGCAVSMERNAVCIFYGNGEYKVWEYPNPGNPERYKKCPIFRNGPDPDYWPAPNIGNTLGIGIIPVGKSFILSDYWSVATDMAKRVITPNPENPLLEPKIVGYSYRTQGCDSRIAYSSLTSGCKFGQLAYRDYTYLNKFLHNVDLISHNGGTDPLAVYELPLKSADTVYLKDGDYIISDTSGTNYKKSVEQTPEVK